MMEVRRSLCTGPALRPLAQGSPELDLPAVLQPGSTSDEHTVPGPGRDLPGVQLEKDEARRASAGSELPRSKQHALERVAAAPVGGQRVHAHLPSLV